MKRSLIVLSAMCVLVLAAATQGAVRKGDVELEIMGGWVMEKAEQGTIPESGGIYDPSQVYAGATGADLDSWLAMVSLGVFTSKNFQVALAGFYTQLEGDDETFTLGGVIDAQFGLDVTAYGVGGRARWHFNPNQKWVPFVGGQAFWVSADVDVTGSAPGFEEILPTGTTSSSPSGILWGPTAGLRCELGAQDELILEYQYHMWAGDLDDVFQPGHGLFVGLAHRLK